METPPRGMRMHHITEDDLAELERLLPEVTMALWPQLDNRLRVQLRRIKDILSKVRWDYGPPTEVEVIPAGDT